MNQCGSWETILANAFWLLVNWLLNIVWLLYLGY